VTRTGHVAVGLIALIVLAAACGVSPSDEPGAPIVGFIFVGERDDLGYNQAA
jgi:basic membrane lipoprotein Med (substrate-binding protein (PBP1-ABC) superfamily)